MSNCVVRSGRLVAVKTIFPGDEITIPEAKPVPDFEDIEEEIDRLADISYEHAKSN